MALNRRSDLLRARSEWEVDSSGLIVYRRRDRRWAISYFKRGQKEDQYLSRHGLQDVRFPTRARAVDAVRLALASEPTLRHVPRTRWEREGEGRYRSRDGHWRLQRNCWGEQLKALTPRAARALAVNPWAEGETRSFPSLTLHLLAREADNLMERLQAAEAAGVASPREER